MLFADLIIIAHEEGVPQSTHTLFFLFKKNISTKPQEDLLINIRHVTRNHRVYTKIHTSNDLYWDWKKILKDLKKECAVHGKLITDEDGIHIVLTSDVRDYVAKFLIEKEIATSKQIRVHDF
jgi:translation initiation factor SUI1